MTRLLSITFPSATRQGQIVANLFVPQLKPPALLIQIVHGMAEHRLRYNAFCESLAEQGYAVLIHDQAGHGESVDREEKLGYFGPHDGHDLVLRDVTEARHRAVERIRSEWPETALPPVILLGHSMGSFISRLYCQRYGDELAGAVFSGTSGRNPAIALALWLARRSVRKNGPLYRDPFLADLTAHGMLAKIESPRTPLDWLSRDPSVVDAYIADPKCGFAFTAAGYADLYSWLSAISTRHWAAAVPGHISILLISGTEDPVGQFGRGPRQVAKWLRNTGHQVKLILYDGGRHEMLNEINRQDVWRDIVDWLDQFTRPSTEKNQGDLT